MKKLFIVLSLVLGISIAATAQTEGGLFHRGESSEQNEGFRDGGAPSLPGGHGLPGNQDANNTPLGGGALLLMGLGAAYALSKKNKK